MFSYWSSSSTFLPRFFGGHEYLVEFGLYHMNARLYDPVTGRFLSPDPYIQDPYNFQNHNPYTYCLNNPFKYQDPSGEFLWWPILVGAFLFGATNAGIQIDKGNVHSLWDGLRYFTQGAAAGAMSGLVWSAGFAGIGSSNLLAKIGGYTLLSGKAVDVVSTTIGICSNKGDNALKILMGRAYIDENRSFLGGIWEGISRYSWQGLQTWAGYNYTQINNVILRDVDRVDYFGGATFATSVNNIYDYEYGISMGNYINLHISDDVTSSFEQKVISDPIFMHEYGHYVDGQHLGPIYLPDIGLSSIKSASKDDGTHKSFWTERRANQHAEKYFKKYYNVQWNYIDYPL